VWGKDFNCPACGPADVSTTPKFSEMFRKFSKFHLGETDQMWKMEGGTWVLTLALAAFVGMLLDDTTLMFDKDVLHLLARQATSARKLKEPTLLFFVY